MNILTTQAGDEEDLEEQVTFVVQDASRSHRHDGQTQVLNGLHAAQHTRALLHNLRDEEHEEHQTRDLQSVRRAQLMLRHHKRHHGPESAGQQRVRQA